MSKSRSERGGKSGTPVITHNAPAQVSNAIIPGKFMDTDWNKLLDNESAEEFIYDILEEVVSTACGIIFDKIIEKRVQPYTVSTARKLLLDIIQWQFLHCDVGESSTSSQSWEEDEEAVAHMTDSWAQGAVPHFPVIDEVAEDDALMEAVEEMDTVLEMRDDVSYSDAYTDTIEASVDIQMDGSVDMSIRQELSGETETEVDDDDVSLSNSSILIPQPPSPSQESKSRSRLKFKKHYGKLPEYRGITSTPVTDERPRHRAHVPHSKKAIPRITDSSQNILQMQQHGAHDIVFDEKGYPVKVEKINFAKLPNHRIATGFLIQEQETEPSWNTRKVKVQPKAEQTVEQIKNLYSSALKSDVVELRGVTAHDLHRTLHNRLPPPLVDSIEVVSAGVVVREAGLVKRGPKQSKPEQDDPSTLRPLAGTNSPGRILTAKDIITDNSPIIRPFQSTRILPGIRPQCN